MKERNGLSWALTAVSVAVATGYAISLSLTSPGAVWQVLDYSARLIGPLGAALIAWAGVSQTVKGTRHQESLKQWHLDLRWATELCSSTEPLQVAIGIAVLDELDDRPSLDPEQAKMVGTVNRTVLRNYMAHSAKVEEGGLDGVQ